MKCPENINTLIYTILVGTVLVGIMLGGNSIRSYRSAKQEVVKLADTNRDNRTSIEEWSKVYQEVGVHFDDLHPQRLNRAQLERYITNHPQK